MTNPILKDGERIDQLFSTDVKIIQNKEVFSYSIDSVLLSRFPKIPKKGLIVDLCSGNGAVGLFASTRTEAPITLVELQERLADMAKRSVTLNQLEDQVAVELVGVRAAGGLADEAVPHPHGVRALALEGALVGDAREALGLGVVNEHSVLEVLAAVRELHDSPSHAF